MTIEKGKTASNGSKASERTSKETRNDDRANVYSEIKRKIRKRVSIFTSHYFMTGDATRSVSGAELKLEGGQKETAAIKN